MARTGGAQDSVISSLRRKLFVTHVAFAAIALLVMGVVIVYVDYQQQERVVYDALSRALEIEARQDGGLLGEKPEDAGQSSATAPVSSSSIEGDGGLAATDGDLEDGAAVSLDEGEHDADVDADEFIIEERDDAAMQGGDPMGGLVRQSISDQFIAISVYEVDSSHVAKIRVNALALDSETAQNALGAVVARSSAAEGEEKDWGKIAFLGLYYRTVTLPDGSMKVAFASENYVNQTIRPLFNSLLIASGIALVGFASISLVLARLSVKPIETAWRQQQQFVADASHELKTPLAVILANNSLIMSDPQASVASQMKWVESTETEAHVMQDLVNDMLFLAKSEFERQGEELGRVDFSDIVQATTLQFESVAFERNVLIEDRIASEVYVRGDATRLQRLTGTLVDNACKYSDENGRVKVELVNLGQTCRLTVMNTGPEIDPDDLPHLFDRFYRSDKARTRGTGGFGLGLAIAKGVVEDLGGSISAASSAADGTTITVVLPTAS